VVKVSQDKPQILFGQAQIFPTFSLINLPDNHINHFQMVNHPPGDNLKIAHNSPLSWPGYRWLLARRQPPPASQPYFLRLSYSKTL